MAVCDASALVNALVAANQTGDRCRERLAAAAELHAPHLIDLEVASALRRLDAQQRLPDSEQTLNALSRLALTRYPHRAFVPFLWRQRHILTPYDGAYVALARALEMPLVTCDAHLARAAGELCRVELID